MENRGRGFLLLMIESGTPYPKLGWECYCAHDEQCCTASEANMIARMWHGRTKAADADKYLEYLNQSGIPDYRRTPGNLGAWVFRRIEGDVAHFITLTFWESREAIRSFAGDNIELARYYPEDKRYLLEFEPGVVHYEVFAT